MFILGVGAAYPDVEVSDAFLASLGLVPSEWEAGVIARAGVCSRRVSLPLEYIQSTKNKVVLDGRPFATATPTSLGAAAARQALERAGISVEQVGLVLADTATPYQTCPSEAQRVAGALGLKVPAHDVVAGAGAIPFFIEMLSSWKPERLPDYVLCVSTNTPSQHGDYAGNALSAHLFGDGAAAFVCSPRNHGRLKVGKSITKRHGPYKVVATVERHITLDRSRIPAPSEVRDAVASLVGELGGVSAQTRIVGPQLFAGEVKGFAAALGVHESSFVSDVATRGYSLGSSAGTALASVWDSLGVGERVVVSHVGDGVVSGVSLEGA